MNILDLPRGQRLLVTVGDNDTPQSTGIDDISPNRLYVRLGSDHCNDTVHGWFKVSDVAVLDLLPSRGYSHK